MATIKCSNCGGTFDEKEPKCPYCGQINEAGAEKEYSKKLETIRKKLDVVDNQAESEYKVLLRTFFKTFIASFVVILIIMLVAFIGGKIANSGKNSIKRAQAVNNMEKLNEYVALTDKWDELFDAGLYLELEGSYSGVSGKDFDYLYSYHHRSFIEAFKYYVNYKEAIDNISEDSPSYYYTRIVNAYLSYVYTYQVRPYTTFSKEEEQALDIYEEKMREELLVIFDISEDDFGKFVEENTKEYPSYGASEDFVKERMGE